MDAYLASPPPPPPPPPLNLGPHLLATAVLDGAALLIAVLVCVALGLLARSRPRATTAVIGALRPLSMAVPPFVLGPLLIFAFVVQSHLLRLYATDGQLFDLRRLILPALTLAIGALALTLGQVRSGMFTFSRADGSWAVVGLHLLGAIVSGTMVVEIIFAWPGLGNAALVYGFIFPDLGSLWSIVLVTSAFYLVVALAAGVAAGVLAQRGAVTPSGPDKPAAGRAVSRGITVTLLGIGGALVAVLVVVTVFAPLFTPNDGSRIDLSMINAPPSAAHPLGADDLGRDILSMVLYAGRVSLAIGALAVILAGLVGLALGALLGLIPTARRRIGAVVDGSLTALVAFPTLFVALGLVVALHPSFTSLVVAFALVQVPTFMRIGLKLMRSRGRDAAGRSPEARRQSIPKALGLLLAQASISTAIVLIGVSALTFFSYLLAGPTDPPRFFGVPPPFFDWGSLIGEPASLIMHPWLMLAPALALGIGVLGLTLVGEALRSLLE